MVSCGSNAFGQAFFTDIMSTSFKAIKFDSSEVIEQVACGSTLSAARLSSGDLYIWGTGLPSGLLKVPTLMPIKNVVKVITAPTSVRNALKPSNSYLRHLVGLLRPGSHWCGYEHWTDTDLG